MSKFATSENIAAAMQSRLIVLASLLLLASGIAFASTSKNHPMRFDQISLDEGLSQSNVLSIWQDSRGLMWFGTENGLNRYDGYEMVHFRRKRGDPNALGSDFIYDINEDSKGNLWIGTSGGGLAMLDYKTGAFTSYRNDPSNSNSIAGNFIRRIMIDPDGLIWLGTRGAGLDRFDPDTKEFTNFRFGRGEDAARNPDEIHALYRDRAGSLWVGSNGGLIKFDTESGTFEKFTHDADDTTTLSDDRVRAVLEDSNGELWIATYGGGLNRFDHKTKTFEQFRYNAEDNSSIASDRVTSIFEDSAKRLWAGTSRGLNLVNPKSVTFDRYTNDETDHTSLADDSITTIYQDRGGILWVGTQNRGLNKWNPRSWSFGLENARKISASGESQPNVTSFVVDSAGTLWIGTFGDGVNAVDRSTDEVTSYRHDPAVADSISDNRVMSLMQDADGLLWIGTMTGGINRLNPDTGHNVIFRYDPQDPASIGADGIMAIFQDSTGLVWAGTFGGGISQIDPDSMQVTRLQADSTDPHALSSNRVTSFAEDASGRIWVGTDAGGLNLYDRNTGQFTHFRNDPDDPASVAADTIYSINTASDGTVWVGTQGGGLDKIIGDAGQPDSIRFANVSQADGLPNDVIYGIQIDKAERLWLSTNYGIARLNPETGDIDNLHRSDGLQSEEFNFGAHYQSATGEMFFGGHNGFNAFAPEDIEAPAYVPLIALTGFYNPNDPLKSDIPGNESDGIDLSYRDDHISFEFAALDYASPSENQYMYKLEGFDSEWIDLGSRRRMTYTDLNDGDYLLRVKAASSDGVWNEAGFSMPISISPAPWDTWWAYLGYFAAFVQLGVFVWLGHRRKIRREEEYSRHLEKAVQCRTDELVDRNDELRELNQSLQESSLSDPLTGLRNRRFVFEEVSRDLEVSRRKLGDERMGIDSSKAVDLVFMMIDLDNFKPINDTYGHAAGDRMLLEVRDVLLGTCRKSDFVVRWGGDEFVVIAKQAKPGESEALAERIRSKIADHDFKLGDGQIVRTTCSIGFAAYPLFRSQADDSSLDQIVNLADSLMYEAKRKRNAWAGLLSPSEAATSANFDFNSIEPSSMLFRARRAGKLARYETESTYQESQDIKHLAQEQS